jgi:hypothetical protein
VGDFSQTQQDKIDLSAITTTGTNPGQPLTFIGTAPFTHHAGEVREELPPQSQNAFVQGDTNGDGIADFNIELYPTSLLTAPILQRRLHIPGTDLLSRRHPYPDRPGRGNGREPAVGDTVMTVFATPVRSPDRSAQHRCLRHPDPRGLAGSCELGIRRECAASRSVAVAGSRGVRGRCADPDQALINGITIEQVPVDKVSYYHVNCRATMLFASCLAESYRHRQCGIRQCRRRNRSASDVRRLKTWRDDAAAPRR